MTSGVDVTPSVGVIAYGQLSSPRHASQLYRQSGRLLHLCDTESWRTQLAVLRNAFRASCRW